MLLTRSTRAGVLEEKGGHAVERRRGREEGDQHRLIHSFSVRLVPRLCCGGREILIRSQRMEGEIRKCIWRLRENSNRIPWRA